MQSQEIIRLTLLVACSSFLIMTTLCAASLASQGNDEALVKQTVEHYLHGLKFNDVPSLKKAFLPDAKLYFVRKDGKLGQLTQDQWYKSFEANAGKEEKGDLRIVAVDVSGNSASIKVVETYDDSIYIDYLSLLKLEGDWKIVNKIYTSQQRKR